MSFAFVATITQFSWAVVDCTTAKSLSTKIICSDLRLTNQDQEFSSKYSDAERYLTGSDFDELEKWRIWFVGNRERCEDDVVCLSKIYGNGISGLDSFMKEELLKPDPAQSVSKVSSFDGNWVSEKYVHAASCGSGSYWDEMEANHFIVDVKYPNVFVTKVGVTGRNVFACKVSEVQNTTYAKVYFSTVYENSYWGSCGGDIERIPYSGDYTFITLKPIDGTEGECGTMVVSGRKGDNQFILWGGDPVAKQLVDDGYILKRKHVTKLR